MRVPVAAKHARGARPWACAGISVGHPEPFCSLLHFVDVASPDRVPSLRRRAHLPALGRLLPLVGHQPSRSPLRAPAPTALPLLMTPRPASSPGGSPGARGWDSPSKAQHLRGDGGVAAPWLTVSVPRPAGGDPGPTAHAGRQPGSGPRAQGQQENLQPFPPPAGAAKPGQ